MPGLVIVTNGNALARLFLTPLLRTHGQHVRRIYVVTGIRNDAGRIRSVMRYLRRSGVRFVASKVATYVLPLMIGWTPWITDPFVPRFARSLGIEVRFITDPNDPEVVRWVEHHPEVLLISVSCPMKLGTPLLDAADVGAINVHSSALPAYAGLAPYVWVLAEGETVTAVTVHHMEERLDTGAVLSQPTVPIARGESAFGLFLQQALVGGPALRDVVSVAIERGALPAGQPQDQSNRSYTGMPTRTTIRELRRRGHRLLRTHDLVRYVRAGRASTPPASRPEGSASSYSAR